MEYGNGNGQYQSMSSPDGLCPDMGQEYYSQSSCYSNNQSPFDESRGFNQGSSSACYGGPGYRSPLRYSRMLKEMNSRNGLYAPSERSGQNRGNGDYYNSLPGIGGNDYEQSGNSGNYSSYY